MVKPSDIREVMDTFNQPFNGSLTMAQCFKRQQKCKDLLKSTAVPLSEANMIWTCLEHFEKVVHLTRATTHWKRKKAKDCTWNNFKKHCKQCHLEHLDEQANCHGAGMANSATTSALADAQATIASKNDQLEAVLAHNATPQALLEEKTHCPTVPPLVETSINSRSTSELTGNVAALSQQIAQLMAALAAQAQAPASAPTQPPTLQGATKAPNRIRPPQGHRDTRFFNNMNCCWSHGFDIEPNHTSATCRNPKQGHQKDTTVTNQMDGCQLNCGKTKNKSVTFKDPISTTHHCSTPSPSPINALLADNPFHALSNDETMVADTGCTTSLANTCTPLVDEQPTSNGISVLTASNHTITGTSKGKPPIA